MHFAFPLIKHQHTGYLVFLYTVWTLHSYTSPRLAWQATLKETKCKLLLLTDINMMLMVESSVRGRLTQNVTSHLKNNKYLPDYDNQHFQLILKHLYIIKMTNAFYYTVNYSKFIITEFNCELTNVMGNYERSRPKFKISVTKSR